MELDKPPPSAALPSCIVRSVNYGTETSAGSSSRGRTDGATCHSTISTPSIHRRSPQLLFPLLLALLLSTLPQNTSASPLWYPASIEPRNIRNLPCVSKKTQETGICMFAFSCFKVNGTHLGTCIDRFYFGSCCQLPESYDPNAIANEVLVHETHPSPLRPHPTRRPTTNATISSLTGKPTRPTITAKPSTVTYTKPTTKPSFNRPTHRPSATKPTPQTGGKPTTLTTPKPTTVSSTTAGTEPNKKPPLGDQILTSTPQITSSSTSKPIAKPTPTRPTLKPTAKPTSKPVIRPTSRPTLRPTSRPSASPTIKPNLKPTPSTTSRPVTKPTLKPVTKPTAKPTQRPSTNSTLRPTLKPTSTKPTIRPSQRPTIKPSTPKPISQQQVSKPTTKPSTTKPTSRPTTPKPTAQTPVTTKPTTPKPATTKPTTPRPTATKPTATKPTATKPTATKPTATKPTSTKPTTQRPTTAKPTAEKPSTKPTTPSTTVQTSPKPSLTVTTTPTPTSDSTVSQSSQGPSVTTPTTITTQPETGTKAPSTIPETQTQLSNEIPAIKPVSPSGVQPPEAVEEDTNAIASGGSTQAPSTDQGSTPSTVSSNVSETTLTTGGVAEGAVPNLTTQEPQTEISNVTTASQTSPGNETVSTTTTPETLTTPALVLPGTEHLNMTNYREVCGRRLVPTSRIVGGAKSTFGKWPWQISLRQWRTSTYLHKCGAALLNENWAITAAHCVENVPPGDLLLRLGEHDLSTETEPLGHLERRVQLVASHPQFDPRTFEYDLALLRFYEPVTPFAANVLPICVPEDDRSFVGSTAYVTGWGRLYEDGPLPSVLQEVRVPVINNTSCEGMYRSAGYVEHIPSIFICAGWKKGGFDSCEGDSGGPMVIQRPEDMRWVLAGVISWGIGCAEPNQPGVYTRISEFRGWINQILQF